jgi:hypothetical protein
MTIWRLCQLFFVERGFLGRASTHAVITDNGVRSAIDTNHRRCTPPAGSSKSRFINQPLGWREESAVFRDEGPGKLGSWPEPLCLAASVVSLTGHGRGVELVVDVEGATEMICTPHQARKDFHAVDNHLEEGRLTRRSDAAAINTKTAPTTAKARPIWKLSGRKRICTSWLPAGTSIPRKVASAR